MGSIPTALTIKRLHRSPIIPPVLQPFSHRAEIQVSFSLQYPQRIECDYAPLSAAAAFSGTPHPVEAGFDYGAKRIKDRFTRDNLKTFVASLSGSAVDAEAFIRCKSFSLIEETYRNADWQARIRSASCTEAELLDPAHGFFQRGMGWVEHMATHATSVITDFEKALQINPAYEHRVRKYLDQAHRQVRGS